MLKLDDRFLDDQRPIVALDIDGVLNYEGGSDMRGVTFKRGRYTWYGVRVRTDMLQMLRPLLEADAAGQIQLAWATMWEADAPKIFAPTYLNGTGKNWPVVYFTELNPGHTPWVPSSEMERMIRAEGAHERILYKSIPMAWFSRKVNRPVIWLDDQLRERDAVYLARHSGRYPVLPLKIPVRTGLTSALVRRALQLAEDCLTGV